MNHSDFYRIEKLIQRRADLLERLVRDAVRALVGIAILITLQFLL